MADDFTAVDLVATPVPGEVAVEITVRTTQLKEVQLPVVGTTTAGGFIKAQRGALPGNEYANYVYSDCSKNAEGYLKFYFGKPKSAEEREVPFREYPDSEPSMWWPAVLLPETFELGLQFTNSSFAILERVWVKYKLRSAQNVPTKKLIREYYAPTPWADADLEVETLGAQEIEWNFGRCGKGTTGLCLHEETYVAGWQGWRETAPGSGIYILDDVRYMQNATQQQDPLVVGTIQYGYPARLYGPTLATDWEDYICLRTQQQQASGGWLLREELAIAPDPQEVYEEVALPEVP